LEDRAKGESGQCSIVWRERVTVVFCSIFAVSAGAIVRRETNPAVGEPAGQSETTPERTTSVEVGEAPRTGQAAGEVSSETA
jgi:hypothetical protein